MPLLNNNGTLYYVLINKLATAIGYLEAMAKDQVIGYTGDYFAIAYKDNSGRFQDPKLVFPSLNGKLSTEKTLGEQLLGTVVIRTDGDDYIVG